MAKLSKDEAAQLKALQDKAKAPDAPSSNRTLNISIDLGDEAQVARAQALGLLEGGEGGDDDDGKGGKDDDDDDTGPQRRGYFGG